ncbi:MAG: sulfatase-like hydrolase/transferase [Candidatus Altiarchaeales archaeon]|nr:sulfatase-like hydrolase/transferase [Candidatus Altiarchaeales archaeon]MBD3416471.1 sulfatase-like hydrolase/transferase [Candidatus Altiarchaeales archaeon]
MPGQLNIISVETAPIITQLLYTHSYPLSMSKWDFRRYILVYLIPILLVIIPYISYQAATGFEFYPLFNPDHLRSDTANRVLDIRTQMVLTGEYYQPFFQSYNVEHPLSRREFDHSSNLSYDGLIGDLICEDCNVVIFLVDALRSDHMGFNGYPRNTTPNLDNIALASVNFANAYSQEAYTTPSVASIFTSEYPKSHGIIEVPFENRLSDDHTTLAEVLSLEGYKTAAFVLNPFMHERKNLGQGFDTYYVNSRGFIGDEEVEKFETASKIEEKALKWLKEERPEKFFLYLHYMDVHYPFIAPKPYDSMFCDPGGGLLPSKRRFQRLQICKYDQEIAYTDYMISNLMGKISEYDENTLFIFTADHGEEFFEHGGRFHVYTIYNEQLKVPLLFYKPGLDKGLVVKKPVEMIDLAPSTLYLLGVEAPSTFKGMNFFNLSYDKPYIYAGGRYGRDMLIDGEIKYIRSRVNSYNEEFLMVRQEQVLELPYRMEVYNLSSDPFEQRNLQLGCDNCAAHLQQMLLDYSFKDLQEENIIETPETVKDQLKSLGYVN